MEEETKTAEETKVEGEQETVETKPETTVETTEQKPEKTVPLGTLVAERRKRQDLERQLQALQSNHSPQPQQEQVKDDEDPQPEDGDPVKLGAWGARQEFKKLQSQQAQKEAQAKNQSRAETALSTVKNTAARLSVEDPEFDTKLETARSKGMDLPLSHEILVGESSDPEGLLKFLIANPAEAVRIQSLDVVAAAREITRLEAKVTQTEKPKKSPPPPIETARGTGKKEETGVAATASRLFGPPG